MRPMVQSTRFLRGVAMSVVFAVLLCGTAFGQEGVVSGKVTTPEGTPIAGVTVRVRGSATSTVTDAQGNYSVAAPADGVLTFSLIGYRGIGQGIGGRSTIDVALDRAIAVLPEVVVTGYTSQRRADITGAVGSVDLESASRQTSTSVLQRLDGRVPGVTIDASASPGSRTTVRIRGITSFQNNDPLYIIDGTPVQDSYLNWLSPDDVGEVQVLKDASAASIYGSRASNGVVIIETKKGRPGARHMALDVRTGVSTPFRGYDDFLMLDALQYYQVVRRSYRNAACAGCPGGRDTIPDAVKAIYGVNGTGTSAPSVAPYLFPNNGRNQTTDTLDLSGYSWPGPGNQGTTLIMPGSAGTNWWDAVFSPAQVTDANLRIAGGGADNAYSVSFNFLNQEGTAAFNRLQRGTIRFNTAFSVDRLVVGENIALSRDQHFGGIPNDDGGEDGILGKNILTQPVVPVYDIGGNFASGKASSLGNNSNPLAYAWHRQFDRNTNDRVVGNVYAGMDVVKSVSLKTRLGFNISQQAFRGYEPITPENSEPGTTNSINETHENTTDWTWSNTATFVRAFDRHNLSVLVGQEANQTTRRFLFGSIAALLNTDPSSRYIKDALANPATKNDSSTGNITKLLSFFGKADYNFAERYYLSVTVRRDGSSTFGPTHRWGTFPAFNVGWRLSQEPFFSGNQFFSNVMLRFGWGVTGNQNVPLRVRSGFGGGRGDTFYDIGNTGRVVVSGFRLTSLGNPDLKWEENKSVNVGVDLAAFQGRGIFTVDVYQRKTDNLLFDPRTPATAGAADPPIVNIGGMKNSGIDFSIGYRGTLGEKTVWSVNFNGSHYKNEITNIDNSSERFFGPNPTRLTDHVVNQIGHAIGSFYGYQADGYFQSAAQIAQLDAAAQAAARDTSVRYQNGAAPGRIKFKDVNGDGRVTAPDDFTVVGSPHPDFTAGLDFSLRRGAWDLSLTLFGTFGNQIFDDQKDFYIFRDFSTNVRKDLLTNSFCLAGDDGCTTPNDPNAKYPRIDNNDVFSRQVSSYYVEDGSYVRLRNLQIGYTVPPAWIRWVPAARIYVQAENLFTITGYPGLDPALPAQNFDGAAGDIRDQYRGVDRGSYPTSRTFTIGISTTF